MKTQNQTTINDTLAILNASYEANAKAGEIRAAEAAAKQAAWEEGGLESARQNIRNLQNDKINSNKILFKYIKGLKEGTPLTNDEIYTTLKDELTEALPNKSRAGFSIEIGHFLSACRYMGILNKEEGSGPYTIAKNHNQALKKGIELFN